MASEGGIRPEFRLWDEAPIPKWRLRTAIVASVVLVGLAGNSMSLAPPSSWEKSAFAGIMGAAIGCVRWAATLLRRRRNEIRP